MLILEASVSSTMAFVFGSSSSTTPTPAVGPGALGLGGSNAPAPGSFNFGGSNAAPAPGFGAANPPVSAPTGGFSFGGTNPAPAPGGFGASNPPVSAPAGGFSFGGTNPAPAPGAFSFNPPALAPYGGGFSFGAPSGTANAPGTTTPTAAPSAFSFSGTQQAPAPLGFALPGSATIAPAPFSLGGTAPAGGGIPDTGFGFAQPIAPTTGTPSGAGAPPLNGVTGKTPYSSLPPEYQKAIDAIHESMMNHKRSMIHVRAIGPQALILSNRNEALPSKLKKFQQSLNTLQQDVETLNAIAKNQRALDRRVLEQAYLYAKWPTEAMAARRGIRLSYTEEKKETEPGIRTQLQDMLARQLPYVDRIERMPSPYLWQTLDEMLQRLKSLSEYVTTVCQQLERSKSLENSDIANLVDVVDNQDQFIYDIRSRIHKIHRAMDKLRSTYNSFETGQNVLEKAQLEEWGQRRGIEEQIQMQLLRSTGSQPPSSTTTTTTPSTNTPNPALNSTGTTTQPAAPTFGSAPSTAPSTPAPAFSFHSGPAPAAPTFGAGPAAPATPGVQSSTPTFGAPKTTTHSTRTPKSKSGSRSSSRSRR